MTDRRPGTPASPRSSGPNRLRDEAVPNSLGATGSARPPVEGYWNTGGKALAADARATPQGTPSRARARAGWAAAIVLTGGGLLLAFAPGKAASEAGIGLMFIGAGLAFLVGWLKIVRRMESEATRDAVGAILLLVGHQVVLVLAGVGLVLIAYGILSLARAAGAT